MYFGAPALEPIVRKSAFECFEHLKLNCANGASWSNSCQVWAINYKHFFDPVHGSATRPQGIIRCQLFKASASELSWMWVIIYLVADHVSADIVWGHSRMHLLLQDAWSAFVETPGRNLGFNSWYVCFLLLLGHAAKMAVETGINSTPLDHLTTAEREGKTLTIGEGHSKRSKTKPPSHQSPWESMRAHETVQNFNALRYAEMNSEIKMIKSPCWGRYGRPSALFWG